MKYTNQVLEKKCRYPDTI